MNRQRTILLVAMTILAMTSGANAYTTERVYPASQSVYVPAIPEAQILTYHARFSGLIWPYIWHQADWYWDGQLYYSDDGLDGQTTESYCVFPGTSVGTHEIKVRAKYDSAPFGVHVWTSYLTWTLTIVDPETYTIERVNPTESSCSTPVHRYPELKARFGGIPSPATWYEALWYVDGVLDKTQALSGQTAESFCFHIFDTVGTYEVKVHGKYFVGDYPVVTRDLTWTVNVVPHPPTASRVSPASPVTLQAGDTRAFTVRGSDPGSGMDGVNIAYVRWYLDGMQQGDFTVGPQPVLATIEHTWSHAFDTAGTHQVEAVCCDTDGYSSPSGQAAWTVVVERQVHAPSASIVSPGSSVTIYAGSSMTFKARGTDAGNDLRLCEVSLDGSPQTNASFSSSASGSTAEWSHKFDTAGTHHVEFAPVDLAGDSGSGCTWTVTVAGHDPSGTIVSPSSSVTINAGVPVTFTLAGTDPANDLWLCEVSLDGRFQTNSYFIGSASGSTATWTHTFNAPGTYRVAFAPIDSANNYGSTQAWTVVVKAAPEQAGLNILVIQLDAQGRAQGPLAGAKVELTGPGAGTATTGGRGQFAFTGLNPGAYTASVSKTGYYAQSRSVSLAAGETKDEVFRLTPESQEPSAFDFTSPDGKHFIEGVPKNLSFSVLVAWNGSPGSVNFTVAGTRYPAELAEVGGGVAQASLTIPAPREIASCSELTIEVTNGEGETTFMAAGVYFYPLPNIISAWYSDVLSWLPEGKALTYTRPPAKYPFWEFESGAFSANAAAGWQGQLSFDPWAGTLSGSLGGTGEFGVELEVEGVEALGEGSLSLDGAVEIALAGCNGVKITPSWTLSASGKAGVGAPAVLVITAVFPPAVPAVNSLLKVPVVGDLLKALRLRLYLIVGGELTGEYEGLASGDCFLGTTSLSGSVTVGLEAQAVVKIKRWFVDAEAGVYAGGTGTPEFTFCPDFALQALTVRAYIGVYASSRGYRLSREVGVNIPLISSDGRREITISSALAESYAGGAWEPIGDSSLRWGHMNLLAGEGSSGGRVHSVSIQGEVSQETKLVENVVPLASPAIVSRSSERLILFCLQDPNKPWFAATDIGTVRQADGQPWVLDRIADDQAAEFSPSLVAVDSGRTLAAWERVSGETSDANDPSQVVPHLEIVAAWFDPGTGLWSTPEQLTSNAVADHQPMAIALGTMRGILWIATEGSGAIGDANSSDRLMFAKWSGNSWDKPQTLWSAQKGILSFAFVADDFGEGHVAFAVDEDADPNTTADCELYLLSTAKGAWQTATRLTSDSVEDAMPTLVAPNGVPMCVWSADGTLVYSPLDDWNPRQVYREHTLANEAPSLDAVTMPGGAAIAYTVQGPNGVDIVASFYDADLDCWSLPRQLTSDEDAETALSLTCDGGELVIGYLKTQTLRTDMDVEIDGRMVHLDNVPQPGRTDLYVLRHALANDLAVVSESMVWDPANPAPGTTATIRATIENRGDLPLQDVVAVFYDGDPSKGGLAIGDKQVIAGTLIAGGKQSVSVSWKVPLSQRSHEVFVVVDPCLAVEDRDRSNNVLSVRTVLPDLAIETCWSTEVSSTSMALTARVVNTGVIPAGAFDVSWRLGAPDGELLGTSTIQSLISGGAYEATFTWDTTGHLEGGQQAQVFAVADSAGSVPEFDETNNVSSLAVFHPPVVSAGAP